MKVKIIRCWNRSWWYEKKIGEVYEVRNYDPTDYIVINENKDFSLLWKRDCEIIERDLADIIEQIREEYK